MIDVVFLYGHVMVTVTAFANWTYVIGLKFTLPRTDLPRQNYSNKKEKNQDQPESEAAARSAEIRLLNSIDSFFQIRIKRLNSSY